MEFLFYFWPLPNGAREIDWLPSASLYRETKCFLSEQPLYESTKIVSRKCDLVALSRHKNFSAIGNCLVKVNGHYSMFSIIFTKGNILCDFLFFPKWQSLLIGVYVYTIPFFSESNVFRKGGKNGNYYSCFP